MLPPEINSGIPVLNNTINPVISDSFAPDPSTSANPLQILIPVLSIVWLVGIGLMLLYTLISYFNVKRKIGTAVLLRDNVFQSENVVSPFVLGIIRPKIYLPFNMKEQDACHVIAHEKAHIRRKDHWWKPLGFLLLAMHWFNPLMWLGYVLLCRDIELACDEKVIKELSAEEKADYSQALLSCSVNRRVIAACPLAFGEIGVKDRVKSVLNYKKPGFWIIVVAIIASIVVAVCFLTNPKRGLKPIKNQNYESELKGLSLEIVEIETSAPDPYITIKYKNSTSHTLVYGDEHYIYQKVNGNWEDCRIDTTNVWNAIAYHVLPDSTARHVYKLNGKTMAQPGKYRFETEFFIEGKPETEYKVWLEFELKEGVEGIVVHTFKPVELVYNDGMYSYVQEVEVAPTFMIVNGMQLCEKFRDGDVIQPRGAFEETSLTKETFDSRFRFDNEGFSWQSDDTLKSLKDNNKRIWQLQDGVSKDFSQLYILLEQKDGTFYIGYGYYNCNSTNPANPDDSHIRWLYKLEEISVSDVGNSDDPVNIVVIGGVEQVKSKFPNYFGLDTTKGLKVYIWQMAENSYSCGILPGKNRNYTMDELWNLHKSSATLDEMRTIIADYMVNENVSESDVIIEAISMPHSSYAYKIDDEYRRNLSELFWSEIPIVENTKYSPVIDTATFDIDGDGKDEQCSLRYGPTSGLFTFVLSVSENGRLEYYNVYNSGLVGKMSFETTTEGIKLHLVPQGDAKPIDYSFSVKDGNIVLSANGENVAYWGAQGVNSR